jgi:hypothetical protein
MMAWVRKKNLPSDTFGMKLYFVPEEKPAPPLPLRPEAFISSMIQLGPLRRISLVLYQSPLRVKIDYSFQSTIDPWFTISVKVREYAIRVFKISICPLSKGLTESGAGGGDLDCRYQALG